MKTTKNINDQKQVLVIDGLRLSLEIEKTMNARLWRTLRRVEKMDDRSHPKPIDVLNSVGLAWQIIDTVHRIRGLAEHVRGLSHKSPEYQLFRRNTASTEASRNFFQHLSSEIPKLPDKTNPIMGLISWVTKDPSKSRTIVYGAFPPGGNFHSLALDTWTGQFASRLEFTGGQMIIDLDNIHREVTKFRMFFEKWLSDNQYLGESELLPSVLSFYIQNRNA